MVPHEVRFSSFSPRAISPGGWLGEFYQRRDAPAARSKRPYIMQALRLTEVWVFRWVRLPWRAPPTGWAEIRVNNISAVRVAVLQSSRTLLSIGSRKDGTGDDVWKRFVTQYGRFPGGARNLCTGRAAERGSIPHLAKNNSTGPGRLALNTSGSRKDGNVGSRVGQSPVKVRNQRRD